MHLCLAVKIGSLPPFRMTQSTHFSATFFIGFQVATQITDFIIITLSLCFFKFRQSFNDTRFPNILEFDELAANRQPFVNAACQKNAMSNFCRNTKSLQIFGDK